MKQVNDMARPRRFRACLMAIAMVPALVLGLSACGGNSAPPQPQVINDKGTPFGDLLVPKLTASVKDGAVGVTVDQPVTVGAEDGVLGAVSMVNDDEGTPVAGELSPDGLTWHTTEPLGYNTRYTLQAQSLGLGGAAGAAIGKLVIYLRTRHKEAVGVDEFLSLGLIAIAYGVAVLCHASGFLAVFAAGLALQRIEATSDVVLPSAAAKAKVIFGAESEKEIATNEELAGTYMMRAVQGFNGQLERIAELVVVLATGAMLSYTYIPHGALAFVLLLFLVARPAAVWVGLLGATSISRDQRLLISWFGIRGVGSIFYLLYAINHGLPLVLAQQLIAITLTTVAASIVVHGISVTPLMSLYARRKGSGRRLRGGPHV